MQHWIVNNKFIICWLFVPFTAFFLTANAANCDPQYSVMLIGGNNPWAASPPQRNYNRFQQTLPFENQPYHEDSEKLRDQGRDRRYGAYRHIYPGNNFISEEFLDSLEQQQSQYQVMPPQTDYHAESKAKSDSPDTRSRIPKSGMYGYPPFGTKYYNDPFYTPPSIVSPWSPWGIGVSDW